MYQASQIHSPVIGVLCVDIAENLLKIYDKQYHSYIPASYVKYLESCGALVVPIWIGKERDYYLEIMTKINGILIPGGAVFFDEPNDSKLPSSNDCVKSSEYIYEIAKMKNQKGEFFPIWGTCLGFELCILQDSEDAVSRTELGVTIRKASAVHFSEDYRLSRMFRHVPQHINTVMRVMPFAHYLHRFCIKTETLNSTPKLSSWKILATDRYNSIEYVTIAENTEFPFYGVQFHPERVAFESIGKEDTYDHSTACVEAAQFLAQFFVNECRKNKNSFATQNEQMRHLILNFEIFFTGKHMSRYLQCYLFTKDPKYEGDG